MKKVRVYRMGNAKSKKRGKPALDASLARAQKSGVLSLSAQTLKKVPIKVFSATKLRLLDLSNNRISTIDEALGQLVALQRLILSNNVVSCLNQLLSPRLLSSTLPACCAADSGVAAVGYIEEAEGTSSRSQQTRHVARATCVSGYAESRPQRFARGSSSSFPTSVISCCGLLPQSNHPDLRVRRDRSSC